MELPKTAKDKITKHKPRLHSIFKELPTGIHSRLVLLQNVNDTPTDTLYNSAKRLNARIHYRTVVNKAPGKTYQLLIGDEVIAEGSYRSIQAARAPLIKLAINNLKRTCFTVAWKTQPDDTPKLDQPGCSSISNDVSFELPVVGSSTTQPLKMKQIDQKEKEANSVGLNLNYKWRENYLIWNFAKTLGLKKWKYPNEYDCLLTIWKYVDPWELVEFLYYAKSDNKYLKLELPTL